MSYQKPAVCTSRQDGTAHAVTFTLLGNSIQWISEQPAGGVRIRAFALAGSAHDVKIAVDGQGQRWLVTSESGAGVLYGIDAGTLRVIQSEGVGAGFINVRALDQGCEVYIPQPGGGVSVFDVNGQLIGTRPMGYASEGLNRVELDGRCISEDEARGPIDLPGGGRLYRIESHDGFTVGQLSDLCEGVGVLTADGQVLRVVGVGYNDQASHFVVSRSGQLWIAVPGENTPAPHEVRLEEIPKSAPPAEPVPPPVPDLTLPMSDQTPAIVAGSVPLDYEPPADVRPAPKPMPTPTPTPGPNYAAILLDAVKAFIGWKRNR